MSFQKINHAFEHWLRTQCAVVEADLHCKHKKMRQSPFDFLRATFFRWSGRIEEICPEIKHAPAVLSVGDTHVENFGTWRDVEGRLVWGINDFDEAAIIPYPFDIVRLATSARLAPDREISNRDAAEAILEGYQAGIVRPRTTLLDEQETWMRPLVACSDKDRRHFWKEVDDYPSALLPVPPEAERGLQRSLPEGASIERFATRRKGGGSLGRPRYVAVAGWRGGHIVREAKALVPSAWDWAHGAPNTAPRFIDLAVGQYRSPDPFLMVEDRYIFRRIAADARKVELGPGAGAELRGKLLTAMGFDIGSIHGADAQASAIRSDIAKRAPDWLYKASKTAAAWVEKDFHEWKQLRKCEESDAVG
jgi:hypothetical protein